MTVGVQYFTHVMTINGRPVKLMIWDTAGQERFYAIAKAYFRGAGGFILVFDITDRKSFESLPRWLRDARAEADPNCSILLVGNKTDLDPQRLVSREEGEAFAKSHDLQYIETSAAVNIGITNAFVRTATAILRREQSRAPRALVQDPQARSLSGSKCPC
jgi:Ras-related protein Rab-2A